MDSPSQEPAAAGPSPSPLERIEAEWLSVKGRVRTAVNEWLARHVEVRQDRGDQRSVRGHDRRAASGPGEKAGRGRKKPLPEVGSGQAPLEERVVIEPAGRGAYELAVPFEVLRALERREHVTKFPVPGEDEQRTARRLYEIARELEGGEDEMFGDPTARALRQLAGRYRELDRCYYVCKPPPPRSTAPKGVLAREDWSLRLEAARSARRHDLAWACTKALQGLPEPISDFYVKPMFRLKKADGVFVRVVEVHNRYGEWFGPLELKGETYSAPSKLRPWLNDYASASWTAGEKELQFLQQDWQAALAFKEVEEVAAYGWHVPEERGLQRATPSGAWFTRTAAIDFQGGVHAADKTGVFRIPVPRPGGGIQWRRYRMSARDREGGEFFVPSPDWHPEVREIALSEVGPLAFEFMRRLHLGVGTHEAYAMAGLTYAYAAAPEVFARLGAFPGIWAAGQFGQGKTTVTEWTVAVFGMSGAVSLEQASVPGLELMLGQVSNLPPLLEEFQTDARALMLSLLKSTFNRTGVPKKLEMGGRRPLTAPVVIGQATSADPATRSRFLHVQISAKRRQGTEAEQKANYDWMQANRGRFWRMGRFLLQNRARFSRRVLEILDEYLAHADVQRIRDDRARKVYGVAYAGLLAAAEVFGLDRPLTHDDAPIGRPLTAFYAGLREWFVAATEGASGEVNEQGELDVFWQKVLTAFDRGHWTQDDLRRMFAAVLHAERPRPPGFLEGETTQGVWQSWHLRINHAALYDAMQEYHRQQNEPMRLKKQDVRDQMKGRPGWVEPARSAGGHADKQRFSAEGPARYWEINLDEVEKHGYRQVTDEEHARWAEMRMYRVRLPDGSTRLRLGSLDVLRDQGRAVLRCEDGEAIEGAPGDFEMDPAWSRGPDPRKGGFYRLIEALTRADN